MITLETPLKNRFWMYAQLVTSNQYKVDDENIDQLKRILEIVDQQEKGIVICGKTGSGKTFIFQILNKVFRPSFHKKRIAIKISDELVANYEKIGDDALELKSHNICIDEIGREKIGKYYGSEQDVIQKIIQKRYNDFKMKGYITYFTSNYSKSALKERYGEHSFSRLTEMCEFINLGTNESYQDRRMHGGTFKNGLPEILQPINVIDAEDESPKYSENETKILKEFFNLKNK